MKRIILVVLITLVAASFVFAGGEGESEMSYTDGLYFAQEDGFNPGNGWKSIVTLEVDGGKIVDVEWNGANVKAGPAKIDVSAAGGYPMVAAGGAQAEWHEQAALVEERLLELQDPAAIVYNSEDGTTDAISGVSIHINEFVELVVKALEAGPVGRGPYRDGVYSAEAAEFASNGWKDKVDLTVIAGRIVTAYWNPYNADGADKYVTSLEGGYGMLENGGAQAGWYEQADKVVAELLESQDPAGVSIDSEGRTDGISGVSIHVNAFFELVQEALAGAM
jgi:major membrane immunogen (membrane-anchored lipoprotein)